MTIEWNKVTWYSKLAAVILFVGVFWLGFWLGAMKAEKIFIEVPHVVHHHDELVTQSSPVNSGALEAKTEVVKDSVTATPKVEWKTYTDMLYKFSMSYPCVEQCLQHKPEPYLPTSDPDATVYFDTFTDKSIKDRNDNLGDGPAIGFPYSLQSLHDALNLPVGAQCKIFDYFPVTDPDVLTPAAHVKQCSLVLLQGEKAARLVVENEYGHDGPTVKYFIPRGPTSWLQTEERYSTREDSSFLIDPTKSTPELKKQVSAVAEVMNTLQFIK